MVDERGNEITTSFEWIAGHVACDVNNILYKGIGYAQSPGGDIDTLNLIPI